VHPPGTAAARWRRAATAADQLNGADQLKRRLS